MEFNKKDREGREGGFCNYILIKEKKCRGKNMRIQNIL